MDIQNILGLFEKVKPLRDGKWMACCPAHGDKSPSLMVSEAVSKRGAPTVSVHCFAGCSSAAVLSAVGLKFSDLYEDELDKTYPKKRQTEFDPIDHERLILAQAEHRLKQGGQLTLEETARVELALERVKC